MAAKSLVWMAKETVSSNTEGSSSSNPKTKDPQMAMPWRCRVSMISRYSEGSFWNFLDVTKFFLESDSNPMKRLLHPLLASNSTFSIAFNPDRETCPNHFFLRGIKALSNSFEKEC